MLRHAASQMDGRVRDRSMPPPSSANGAYSLHRIHGSVPEESPLAVDDLDEVNDAPSYGHLQNGIRRRLSEHSASLEKQFPTFASLENRTLPNVRKAPWQTSLGFGSIADIPQSRRHSFADVPTIHHASVSSLADSKALANHRTNLREPDEGYLVDGALPNAPGQGHNRKCLSLMAS